MRRLHLLWAAVAASAVPTPAALFAAQPPPIPLAAQEPTTAPVTTQQVNPDPNDGLPHSVVLKTGERVTGRILSRSLQEIVVASDAMGVVTVNAANIAQIIGPQGEPQAAVPMTVDDGLFGTGLFRDWDRQFEVGVTGTTGTTDSIAFNTQFNASEDNPSYRSTVGASYFLNQTESSVDRNQTRVFATFDKRLDDGPWFVFARSQYDNDSLQEWENRISAFAGPGYEFIKTEKVELLGRVGVGYTHEFGGDTPGDYDDSRFEGLVGIDYKWVIDPAQTFLASSYLTPSLEDVNGEGRVVTNVAYQVDLNQVHGFGVKMGFEHTYDFKTPGEDEHNNVKYFVNLLMKL